MKRSGYKTVITLLIVQAVLLLSATLTGSEVNKKFNKEFNTQGKELLTIDNRYGNVTVESWSENRVVIDVLITIEHPSQDKAEKLLSMVEIKFIDDGSTIGASTEIDSKFSFGTIGSDHKFSIDYVVKMPVNLNFEAVNRYGNIDIDELTGRVDITVKYGSLFADKLVRGKEKPLNKIAIAYGTGEINELGWAELYLRYTGRTTIGKAGALLVDSRYSKLDIENAGSVVLDSKYDNIFIGNLKNLVSESGYTAYKLGRVGGKLDIETGYGSFEVEELLNGFESIDITTRYCSVKVGVAESADYKLNANAKYGSIRFNEDRATINNRIVENNSKTIEAVIGSKAATSTININTSYGSIRIY